MKLFTSLTLMVWLFMATSTALAKSSNNNLYVLDTNGKPVEPDQVYYIKPAITDNGGRFTLINRNGSCPLYVGLENTDLPKGYPVRFTSFIVNIQKEPIRVNGDLTVEFFEVSSTCVQSTQWKLGPKDTRSGRRLVITGRDDGRGSYGNYFRIVETQNKGIYNIEWCPTEVCSTCRFICGRGGILRENGKILFGLDGPSVLPVKFQKKDD